MIAIQNFAKNFIKGSKNYLKPEGKDANLGVWHFFCLNFATEGSARLLAQALVRLNLYGYALSAKTFAESMKGLRSFFNFVAPLSVVNHALKGNYFKAIAYLDQSARATKTLMKSKTFDTAIKPTLQKVVPFASRVTTEGAKQAIKVAMQAGNAAWLILSYRDLPDAQSVKKLAVRCFKDSIQLIDTAKKQHLDIFKNEELKSLIAADIKEICQKVESVGLFSITFLGVIYAMKVPSSVTMTVFSIIGISNITAHIASYYINPVWQKDFKEVIQKVFTEGKNQVEDTSVNEVQKEEIHNQKSLPQLPAKSTTNQPEEKKRLFGKFGRSQKSSKNEKKGDENPTKTEPSTQVVDTNVVKSGNSRKSKNSDTLKQQNEVSQMLLEKPSLKLIFKEFIDARDSSNFEKCKDKTSEIRALIKTEAKKYLINLIQNDSEQEVVLAPSSKDIIYLNQQTRMLIAAIYDNLSVKNTSDPIEKQKNAYIYTMIAIELGGVIDETARELRDEGAYKTISSKLGDYLSDISNLRRWSKISMFPLRIAEELFGQAKAGVVAGEIHKAITPLVIFRTPIEIIRPLTEIHFIDMLNHKHDTVMKASLSLQNFFYDGIKIVKWALPAASIEFKGWYSKTNLDKVQNLWAVFAFIGLANDAYILFYAGEDIKKPSTPVDRKAMLARRSTVGGEGFAKIIEEVKEGEQAKHKNSIYEDWKARKKFREIATTERIIKSIEIIGGMAGCIMVGMAVLHYPTPYVETLKLASQIAQFGPRMVHEFFQDQPNPAVA